MIAAPIRSISATKIVGLIALSVVAMSLAFAPVNQFYLAWLGLVPFFLAIDRTRSQFRAFLWGWLGGIFFFLGNMWWLSYVTWPGMFALVGYLGLYWGFAAMLLRGCRILRMESPLLGAILMGAGWTAFDWMRGSYSMFGAHGLPWLYLGDTQTAFLPICQIADITGVYGVTFLIVFANVLLAVLWLRRDRLRTLRISLATGGAVVAATILYGVFRMAQNATFPGPTVLVVQPNYPQSNTGEKGAPMDVVAAFHVKETQAALAACRQRGTNVDLVVWSETMMAPLNPESLQFNRAYAYGALIEDTLQQIGFLANQYRTSFLVGSTYGNGWQWENKSEGTYAVPSDRRNSAYLIDQNGELSPNRYDKIQLLPFGEFIPFRDSSPWLYRLLLSLGPADMASYELTAGRPDALTVFSIDARNADAIDAGPKSSEGRNIAKPAPYRFVVPICFEDIVAPLVTDLMRTRSGEIGSESSGGKRADFIVNVTNDGWFKAGERAQHMQAAVFRSIENRVPTARSVNTGISGFIDSVGRQTDLLHENAEGWSVHQLSLDHRRAIHTVIGELFAECAAMVTAFTIISALVVTWQHRRARLQIN